MKKIIAGLVIYCFTIAQVFGQAALIPNAKQTFVGPTGAPLAGGSVTYYVPNSTNKKTTWQTYDQTVNNTNPVILDSAGRGVMFGQGAYRQVVKDKNGVTIWDSYTSAYGSSSPSGATGTDTAPVGSIIPWASFTLPTNWQYAYGQTFSRTDYADLFAALTIKSTTVSCTATSTTLSGFSDTSQIRVGAPIEASCFATGVTVASIVNSSTITISSAANSTATVTATVFPWGNGDGSTTFNVPDLRGRVLAGPDSMGGTAARRFSSLTNFTTTSGSLTGTVVSSSGLFAGMSVVGAGVAVGTTISSLSGTTVTLSGAATASGTNSTTFYAFNSANAPASSGGSTSHVQLSTEVGLHNHTITDPGHTHTANVNGSSVTNSIATNRFPGTSATTIYADTGPNLFNTGFINSATTGISINNNTGASAFQTLQPTIAINYIIKVKANTTGAGGVVSVGGMFGDIICDGTFLCANQTIGLATQSNLTMLANISGSSLTPTGITNTQWLDATVGSTQGTIAYRGPLTWVALSIGANGTFLKSNGSIPTWGQLPVASSSLTGVIQGDGSTVTINGSGVLSCTTSTSSQLGCVKPDGTTIVASGGTLTAIGAATTSIGVGTTTVAAGTSGYLLYNNAGVLGNATFASLMGTAFGLTRGSILYNNGTTWTTLAPGSSGNFLRTNGAGADPTWSAASVAAVTSLNGLSGTLTLNNGSGISTILASGTALTVTADIATNSNIWGATANKLLDAGNVFNSAGQLVAATGTTSVTLDLSTGFNFTFTATSGTNFTLQNPTNPKVGQTGCVYLVQGTPLTSTISYGSNWKTAGGLTGKTLSTTANAVDRLCYFVRTSSFIDFTLANGIQ